jgi:hypothetical protein
MAWTKNPVIRDLEPYCKKHGYDFVVVYAVKARANQFVVNTYGQTAQLCKVAAIAGDQLPKLVTDGVWPNWPDKEPQTPEIPASVAILIGLVEAASIREHEAKKGCDGTYTTTLIQEAEWDLLEARERLIERIAALEKDAQK